ncbi:MAG TPA: hypothetical protein VFZ73_03470 [Gemmatimonadaceae bacterium]
MARRSVLRGLRLSVIAWLAVTTSCGADEVLSPADFEGQYPLVQVNGRGRDWFHQVSQECQAAFRTGSLIITTSSTRRVKQFRFRVDYDYRCLGTHPVDGSATLDVTGTEVKSTEAMLVLNGYGPDMVSGLGADRWSLEARPVGANLEVRIWGLNGQLWGEPVFLMGPKQTYDGPCFVGC